MQTNTSKKIYSETPPSNTWERIETLLDKKEAVKKVQWWRFVGIAAIGAFLLSSVYIMLQFLDGPSNPALFSSNGKYTSMPMESLPTDGQPVYDLKQLKNLNAAYAGQYDTDIEIKAIRKL